MERVGNLVANGATRCWIAYFDAICCQRYCDLELTRDGYRLVSTYPS